MGSKFTCRKDRMNPLCPTDTDLSLHVVKRIYLNSQWRHHSCDLARILLTRRLSPAGGQPTARTADRPAGTADAADGACPGRPGRPIVPSPPHEAGDMLHTAAGFGLPRRRPFAPPSGDGRRTLHVIKGPAEARPAACCRPEAGRQRALTTFPPRPPRES